MPNQTQQTPQAGSSVQASDGTPLNPLAVNIAKAIRQQESNGNYYATGDGGQSHGAYQFNKDNFQNWAKQYNLDSNDFSPTNQDKVAYSRINDLLQQGRSPSEVAALWNGAHVENGKYVANNPAYVEGVKQHYAQIVGSPQQTALGGQTAQASTGTEQNHQTSTLGKLMDFAFPIVNDFSGEGANKTALQKLGDLGLSALWFVPGVGEGAEAAIRGAGLLGEAGAKIAGHAIGGATTGYASDVASKLSQGDTNAADVLTPGMGTLTGGALGGALGKLGSKYTEQGVIDSTAKSNNSVLGQWKGTAQDLGEALAKGTNQGEVLAKNGINLRSMYNPETLSFETQQAANQLRGVAGTANDALSEAIARVPGTQTVTDLEQEMLSKIPKNNPEQAQIVQKEMSLLRQQYGENLSAADVNEWKQRAWNLSKFDTAVPSLVRSTYKMIGNTLKTKVENMGAKAGLGKDIAELNKFIGSHLDTADALDAIHGNKVKGGRIGDILTSKAAGVVGGAVGSTFGGPVGSLLGFLAGDFVGNKGAQVSRYIKSAPVRNAILKRIVQQDPEALQRIRQFAQQTPQGLEAITQHLRSEGVDIFKGPKIIKKTQKQPSLMSKLLKKSATSGIVGTGARAGSQFNSPVQ